MIKEEEALAKSLKVTLISPPSNIEERYPKGHPLRKSTQVVEPLGLAYLAAMIENIVSVDIVDCIAKELSLVECTKRVEGSDVVGISSVTSNVHIALMLAIRIKHATPNVKIIFGGIHPSLYPLEILKRKEVDVVVIGEGEYVLHEILNCWNNEEDIDGIAGIAFKRDGEIIVNPLRPQEKMLDQFPFPARHLLPMELYRPFVYLRKPARAIISSRGCPFLCVFCCRDISGRRYRLRKPEKVIEEIKELSEKWNSKEIDFQDPVFGLNENWVRKFCKMLINEKLDLVWSALTRVDLVDKKLLRLMKKAGCWMLYYGIEAGNQQLLNNIKKKTTLELIRKSVQLTSSIGIKTWGSFMFALPGEDPKLAEDTLSFAKSLPLDFASFHLTTPFPGTELWKDYKNWGRMIVDWSEFTQLNPVFIPFGWEKHEDKLKEMLSKAFKSFYLRPNYILRELSKIRSVEDIALYYRGLKSLF